MRRIPSGLDWTRITPRKHGKKGVSDQSGAECGALGAREAPLDPELAAVVDAWPALPEAIEAGNPAMIRAADLTDGEPDE